jgi:hypothetical protein
VSGISGALRTDDGGTTWKPIGNGFTSVGIPDPHAEVGHCVDRLALHRSRTQDAGDNGSLRIAGFPRSTKSRLRAVSS